MEEISYFCYSNIHSLKTMSLAFSALHISEAMGEGTAIYIAPFMCQALFWAFWIMFNVYVVLTVGRYFVPNALY